MLSIHPMNWRIMEEAEFRQQPNAVHEVALWAVLGEWVGEVSVCVCLWHWKCTHVQPRKLEKDLCSPLDIIVMSGVTTMLF